MNGDKFNLRIGYSLDDILLVPKHNTIPSRLATDTTARLTRNHSIAIPIMATNMSTVSGIDMMRTMGELGGVAALHRFLSIEEGVQILEKLRYEPYVKMASIGVGDEEYHRAQEYIKAGATILLIDIAHGDSDQVLVQLDRIKKNYDIDVMVGNIATYDAAQRLINAGADGLRVGIGGGSRCITRTVTGHGVPNLTALTSVVRARDEHTKDYIPVVLDGGIKYSGDIVKALYFGADIACLGGMLAGTSETPGDVIQNGEKFFKKYYGMASKEAQETHRNGMKDGTAAEGFSEAVPYRGSVVPIVEQLVGGIRSGLTYSGARSITDLREKGEAMLLTTASQSESKLR